MTPQLLTVIKEEALKTWADNEWVRWWVEPKYDGARLIYHKGQFLSRTGKPLHNLQHIADELRYLTGWTLDGEVYGEDWSEAMSVARASKSERTTKLQYAVFDILDDHAWEARTCADSLAARRSLLCETIKQMKHEYVHVMPYRRVKDFADFAKVHRQHLLDGCDGTVLKLAESHYEFKRTKTWLKVKPVETFDCCVVGMKEGTGKYKGMLGSLEVLPETHIVTTFVSGMDDANRFAWWDEPKQIIGKTIEVSARGVHASGRLIEPRFIRIREDK